MLRTILMFGVAAGLIVIVPMSLMLANAEPGAAVTSQFAGYLIMLLALSLIFVGVKRYRDQALGGVIKFVPAFLMGLGISAVAGFIYVIGWEITLALTDYAFIDTYANAAIEAERAKGASPADARSESPPRWTHSRFNTRTRCSACRSPSSRFSQLGC